MDLASLRAQQIELASSVIREDRLDKDPPDLILSPEPMSGLSRAEK